MTSFQEEGSLWLPFERHLPLHICRLGQMSTMIVENKKLAQEMAHIWGGRAAKPQGVMTIPSADNTTPIMIAGLGHCEVAELEDIALEAIEKDAAQIMQNGGAVDFAAERERRGLPSRESFDQRFRDAMQARADYGRANMRTALTTPMEKMSKGQAMVAVPHNYPGGQ